MPAEMPGGRHDVAVVDEAAAALHLRLRVALLQVVDRAVEGRDLEPVEQARLAEHERARAHRLRDLGLDRRLLRPREELGIVGDLARRPAREQHDVGLGRVLDRVLRHHVEALGVHRVLGLRDDVDVERGLAVRRAEVRRVVVDLERAGPVERLGVLVDDDRDVARVGLALGARGARRTGEQGQRARHRSMSFMTSLLGEGGHRTAACRWHRSARATADRRGVQPAAVPSSEPARRTPRAGTEAGPARSARSVGWGEDAVEQLRSNAARRVRDRRTCVPSASTSVAVAAEQRLDLAHAVEVDDRRAVHAEEPRRDRGAARARSSSRAAGATRRRRGSSRSSRRPRSSRSRRRRSRACGRGRAPGCAGSGASARAAARRGRVGRRRRWRRSRTCSLARASARAKRSSATGLSR